MSIFGSIARFALQVELLPGPGDLMVAHICLWANAEQIGDSAQAVMLSPVADFFRGTIRLHDRHLDPEHAGLSAEQALKLVLDALVGDAIATRQLDAARRRQMERYRGLIICPNGCLAFDGEAAVLVARNGGESFIWQNFTDKRVRELALASGEYADVIGQFLAWADPLAGHDPTREHFAGKTFVIVGSFSRPQDEIARIIRRLGGRVDQTVSERTSYVVAGQLPSEVSKDILEARALNIPILSEAQFEDLRP